ncbi:MAG: 4-hydroxybenzoate octaprenyltransferase [Thermodesulfobacteriota bacterium]
MNNINKYSKFIKLEHTLFSFPIVLAGSFLAARGVPPFHLLILILLAAAGARTAAMGLNRIIDRKIDSLNPRTKDRELPSGEVSMKEGYAITGFGLGLYFASCYLICNLVFHLSPIPLIIFILYPYMKRFTPFCHFGVGLALAFAPLGGWVAVTCSLNGLLAPILLALFTLFWVSGFDIIYATLDEKFDIEYKIYSMVSVYGREKALRISAVCHIVAFLSLVVVYFISFSNIYSGIVLLLVGLLLFLEHRKSSNVDLAFFKINILVGGAVFLFIICGIYLN